MKKTLTLLILLAFGVTLLRAQIPQSSPIPVEVRMEAADGFIRKFDNYLGAADWCDTLIQTTSGSLVWAYGLNDEGIQTDSLLCDSTAADLTGKMAIIRRGACEFGWKAFRAQQAGAIGAIIVNNLYESEGGGIVSMGAGDWGAQVNIPTIFLTREDGDILLNKLDNGIGVTIIFEVKPIGGPVHYYSYQTPVAGITPLKDVSINFVNTSATTVVPSITIDAKFTDPTGQETTISQTATDIPPLSFNNIKFDEAYTPAGGPGEYTVEFSNSFNAEKLTGTFVITDYTYAQDNNVIDTTTSGGSYNGTLEPSEENFVNEYNLTYDFGNFYRTGPEPLTATHATFVLGSYNELWTGDPEADVFKIRIYDADPDGNGVVPDATTYDELNEAGGENLPIGGADYLLNGSTPDFTVTTVELDDPITLQPNKIYLVMVQYNGISAGIGIPPKPALGIGSGTAVAGGLSSARYNDRFYRDGWGTNVDKFIVRLHLDGFNTGTVEPLEKTKISLSPNPTADVLRLHLELEKPAPEVTVRVLDFTGRLLRTQKLENVHTGTYTINVKDLVSGTYFLAVTTPEGYRSRKFQIVR